MESYEKLCKIARVPFAHMKGYKVCISHVVITFGKASDEKCTREIFEVVQSFKRFGICKYHLCNLEDVKGTFYEPELQLVDYSTQGSFEVEKVIEKKRTWKKRRSSKVEKLA